MDWSQIELSSDGKDLLISTRQDVHYLVDGFSGALKRVFKGHVNTAQVDLQATFSPDSMFVFSGSQDGTIHVWNRDTGVHVAAYEGHKTALTCLRFNPKYCMFASACTKLVSSRTNQSDHHRHSGFRTSEHEN